jgi:putative endonuclease
MEWLDQEPDATKAMLTWARDELAYQTITDHLTSAGLRIIDRGWHCAEGQADIIAADRQMLVICQVISRPTGGRPRRVLGRARARRLRRLGIRWLTAHGVLYDEIRVDLVSLTRDPSGEFIIEHVQGVA